MISISLKQLINITNGQFYNRNNNNRYLINKINDIRIDTRKVIAGSLFIALIGKNFDGHEFINEAINKNASLLLLEKKYEKQNSIPQIIVKNTTIALGQIAAWIRNQVNITAIAITGSTGKTSVKEMATSIFKEHGNTLSNFRNFNNNIGVPLTLLKLNNEHKYAILELGANRPKEIEYTVKLTQPNIALINNIYYSHLEGFKSLFGVSRAKQEIFLGLSKNGIAVFNSDNNHWKNWKKKLQNQTIINFSIKKKNSDVFASNIQLNNCGSSFIIHTPYGEIDINLPLLGYHNISNALAATSLGIAANIPLKLIKIGLSNLPILFGRLQIIRLNKYKTIINDAYNSNVSSMITAIKVLEKMPGYKIIVVGDMLELGSNSNIFHKFIGNVLNISNINKVFSIGKLSQNISLTSKKGKHYLNSENLIRKLNNVLLKNPIITILIKGSRKEKLEIIVKKLIQEYNNVIFNN